MAGATSTCFKFKKLLFGSLLSQPPNQPSHLTISPTAHALELRWKPAPRTSSYNTDAYVVEVAPRSPQLVAALGEFARHVQVYSGANATFTLDKLQPEQAFAIRVRCVNSKGASGWVEAEASTCQMPTNCGGTGPLGIGGGGRGGGAAEVYSWDQTPTHVEICIPAPRDCTAKQVAVRVKPRSIEVLVGGEAVFAGKLPKEVRCQEDGDFEWELRDAAAAVLSTTAEPKLGPSGPESGLGAGGAAREGDATTDRPSGGAERKQERARAREVFITLEKRIVDCVCYDPQEQWDRVLDEDGHPRIDRAQLRWFRDYQWRPPQDARNAEEVKMALPGMHVHDVDQSGVAGRDGELDDWGRKWSKGRR